MRLSNEKIKPPFTTNHSLSPKLKTMRNSRIFDFALKDCLFGTVKWTKNTDPDKYSYYGYGIKFDSRSLFRIQILTAVKIFWFLE